VALLNIAKLEGSMGIAANRDKMTPQQYEAYLVSKRTVKEDALKAAAKPPPSRSVRDIKLMIVQSMIENGDIAICNMQYAMCNMQYAICNMQYAICNMQYAICNM
jgi:hypothetical protein